MVFHHCPDCGAALTKQVIGDEGSTPYCEACGRPWFPLFPVSVIMAVTDGAGRVALIRQSYGDTKRFVCVAGYMKQGEDAESAAVREVLEELGLKPQAVRYVNSYFYEKRGMLMLGFAVRVPSGPFILSQELSFADWFSYEDAIYHLRNSTIARRLVEDAFAAQQEET